MILSYTFYTFVFEMLKGDLSVKSNSEAVNGVKGIKSIDFFGG
jgi:hypothetical protein